MKKIIYLLLILSCNIIWGQVGINASTPSAGLDIVSKGNTSTTKAIEINNTNNLELFKISDNGYVGINIGTASASDLLHINADIKHENLLVLSSPYTPLGIDGSGGIKVQSAKTKYFYYKRTSPFGDFTLSNTNTYTSIPFTNGADVKGNTVGFDFGSNASATIDGQPSTNVSYLIIPEPGVYLFEMYQTAYCTGLPSSTSNTGQIALNTVFATAPSGSSVYSTNTIFRDYSIARRNVAGAITSTSYAYANPQKLVVAYQSTSSNEKVALLVNYAGGDSYNTATCRMNMPANSDNYGYLIVTKL